MQQEDREAAYIAADTAGRTPRVSLSSMSDSSRNSRSLDTHRPLNTTAFDAPPSPSTGASSPNANHNAPEDLTSMRLRKRADMLRDLLSSLDSLVLANLAATYYFDTLSLLFLFRTLAHRAIQLSASAPVPHIPPALAPILSAALNRQSTSSSPQLALLLGTSILAILLHLFMAAPSAGEATRGYLHGGLFIDFVGQQTAGPVVSRIRLLALDIISSSLSVIMVCVLRECLRCEVAANADLGVARAPNGFGLVEALLAGRSRRMQRLRGEQNEAAESESTQEYADPGPADADGIDEAFRPMLEEVDKHRDGEDDHPLDAFYGGQTVISTVHVLDTTRNCLLDFKAGNRLGSV